MVNKFKIYQFKIKYSESYPVCSGNISKDFGVDDMEPTVLNAYMYDFLVDYGSLNVYNILNIHKYLMKKNSVR